MQKPIDINQIMEDIESKPLFSEILQNNDFLIGMVLGYTEVNSKIGNLTRRHPKFFVLERGAIVPVTRVE